MDQFLTTPQGCLFGTSHPNKFTVRFWGEHGTEAATHQLGHLCSSGKGVPKRSSTDQFGWTHLGRKGDHTRSPGSLGSSYSQAIWWWDQRQWLSSLQPMRANYGLMVWGMPCWWGSTSTNLYQMWRSTFGMPWLCAAKASLCRTQVISTWECDGDWWLRHREGLRQAQSPTTCQDQWHTSSGWSFRLGLLIPKDAWAPWSLRRGGCRIIRRRVTCFSDGPIWSRLLRLVRQYSAKPDGQVKKVSFAHCCFFLAAALGQLVDRHFESWPITSNACFVCFFLWHTQEICRPQSQWLQNHQHRPTVFFSDSWQVNSYMTASCTHICGW